MTKLSDILAVGNQAIALGQQVEWLEPLAALGAKWTALAARLNAMAEGASIDSIESLLAFLQGKLEDEVVVEAFEWIGLPELRKDLIAFSAIYDSLPAAVKLLAAPLSAFAETETVRADDAPRPIGFRDDWVGGADPGKVSLPLSLLEQIPITLAHTRRR
jgi:hypothetical protein